MSETKNKNWESREIGALWKKESKADKTKRFMTGNINFFGEKIPIIIFLNNRKLDKTYKPDVDKKDWPDFIIYRDEKSVKDTIEGKDSA